MKFWDTTLRRPDVSSPWSKVHERGTYKCLHHVRPDSNSNFMISKASVQKKNLRKTSTFVVRTNMRMRGLVDIVTRYWYNFSEPYLPSCLTDGAIHASALGPLQRHMNTVNKRRNDVCIPVFEPQCKNPDGRTCAFRHGATGCLDCIKKIFSLMSDATSSTGLTQRCRRLATTMHRRTMIRGD